MVPVLVYAIGAAITFGIGDFLAHRFAKKADGLETLWWTCLFGAIVLAPFALPNVASLTMRDIGFLAATGVIGFFSGLCVYAAYNRADLSLAELVLQLELPVTIALGVLLLGEHIGWISAAAIATLLIGLYLVTGARLGEVRSRTGIGLAIAGAVLLGATNYFVAVGARLTDSIMVNWVLNVIIAGLCAAVLFAKGRMHSSWARAKGVPKLVLGFAAVDTLAWVLYTEALRQGSLSVTGSIVQGYPVVAVWLAVHVGKERLSLVQWLGAGLVIAAGVVLGTQL